MSIERNITSRENPVIKRARRVRDGKVQELVFVEGVRLAEEALDSEITIDSAIYAPDILNSERGRKLLNSLRNSINLLYRVPSEILKHLSDTQNSQGIVLIANRPSLVSLESFKSKPGFVVILDRINNPLNAGAILRTAAAGGVDMVITTDDSTDIFSPKSLRASMGAAFRVPVCERTPLDRALTWCETSGLTIFATSPHQARTYTEANWRQPLALLLGSEANGLQDSQIPATAENLSIPMTPLIESLNIAAAAAILIFERVRQHMAYRQD